MTPAATVAAPRPDPRLARCQTDLVRYGVLMAELAAVLLVFRIDKFADIVGDSFFRATALAAGGFALHYWLPLRAKEWSWIALSLGGAFWILEPATAAWLLLVAGLFFAIGRLRIAHLAKVGLIVLVGALCTIGRVRGVPGVPAQLWPVLGSVFVFRLLVWTYDLKHMKERPSLRDFLAYFFMLPNWGCLLFPVLDFHTMRKSFLARDIHEVAQRGIGWMARGLLQFALYDLVYYRKPIGDPGLIDSPWKLLLFVVTTYLLYLRLSGTFHFVIGMLHLFGYDLPETHRKYFLASSLTDFWRRINLYWKDFMVKLVYFPMYFRLRRRSEVLAQIVATACVFLVTWFLHAWQTFWITGRFLLSGPDIAFWGVLGLLVSVNLLLELRGRTPGVAAAAGAPLPLRALKVGGTFLLLATLWSMWNTKSFEQWFDLLTYWKVGR